MDAAGSVKGGGACEQSWNRVEPEHKETGIPPLFKSIARASRNRILESGLATWSLW